MKHFHIDMKMAAGEYSTAAIRSGCGVVGSPLAYVKAGAADDQGRNRWLLTRELAS